MAQCMMMLSEVIWFVQKDILRQGDHIHVTFIGVYCYILSILLLGVVLISYCAWFINQTLS